MTEKEINELADDALSAACLHIQQKLGQDDGGIAGVFFSGDMKEQVLDIFANYIQTELIYADDDGELTAAELDERDTFVPKPKRASLKEQVLAKIQEQFPQAWLEHFLDAIFIPFNGRKVDLVFGTANETWGGDVSEADGHDAGNVLGDPLATDVSSESQDPDAIADAILQQVYAWLERPFLGIFDLGIRHYSEQGVETGKYLVYFEDDEVARVEDGAVRLCWSEK